MNTALIRTVLIPLSVLSVAPPGYAAFRVHEWGTFTSVQGSDGENLAGLEAEEEALPAFVHNRDPGLERARPLAAGSLAVAAKSAHCHCKGECCFNLARNAAGALAVTQKMETPVLYFYSDRPMKADVTVDFPKGLLSQYYPAPTAFLPSLGPSVPLAGGRIQYSGLEVLDTRDAGDSAVPRVAAGNVYAPARATASNLVRIGDETEKFIFYRGLGNFRSSLKVTSDASRLRIRDTHGRGLPYVLAVNIQGEKGAFRELGALAGNESRAFGLGSFLKSLEPRDSRADFEAKVAPALAAALVRSGLYPDEASAMVNTWKTSYFRTNGLRILYILPRAETDALLPIRINPAPTELVRTLVGRVEVMTTVEERALSAAPSGTALTRTLGRFAVPKLARIRALLARKR